MTDFQPIQFARMPARRRSLRIAELFSLGTDEQGPPGLKINVGRPIRVEVQPRRSAAM
jgi:hypothetical protein